MHSAQIWQERSLKDVLMQGQISGLIKNGFYLETKCETFSALAFLELFSVTKEQKTHYD